jgi:hypothetical protein
LIETGISRNGYFGLKRRVVGGGIKGGVDWIGYVIILDVVDVNLVLIGVGLIRIGVGLREGERGGIDPVYDPALLVLRSLFVEDFVDWGEGDMVYLLYLIYHGLLRGICAHVFYVSVVVLFNVFGILQRDNLRVVVGFGI